MIVFSTPQYLVREQEMTSKKPISMFDNVRVRSTPSTKAVGLAGLTGQVYGSTTPSITGVEVIGDSHEDIAINVHFEDRSGEFWFAPGQLEFMDHAPGTKVKITGAEKELVRTETGEWTEHPGGERHQSLWEVVRRIFKI